MNGQKSSLQRYTTHLSLIILAALFFLGAKVLPVRALLDSESREVASSDMVPESDAGELQSLKAYDDQIRPVNYDLEHVPVPSDNSLSIAFNPYTFEGQRPEHQLITYTVQANDTPIAIADEFSIQPETLLGGNPFLSEESNALRTGTELIILPVDGLLHDVREGDTLESVARQYDVGTEEIIAYEPNRLEFPNRLYPGTQILVPGAVREVFVWTAPAPPPRPRTSDSTGSGVAAVVQGTGFFIWPTSNRHITQYYWYAHQAIDIAVPEGAAVVASDTGTVTWAGWNVYGYGNLIVINHGNGHETYYAHLSSVNVYPGQVVYQGAYIGASGNTGRSSGPHLHFEIRLYNSLLEPLGWLR